MKTFNLNNFIQSILKDGGATFHLPTGRMTFKEGYFVGSANGEMITNLGNQRYKEEVIENKVIDAVKEFISENGFEPKSPRELVRGVKMYLKNMDIKGVPFGAFDE